MDDHLARRVLRLEQQLDRVVAALATLAQQAARAEQAAYQVGTAPPGGSGGSGGLIPATTTSSITSGSYASPGTGSGTRLDTSTSITIKNPYGTTLATSKFCWVKELAGGNMELVVGDC